MKTGYPVIIVAIIVMEGHTQAVKSIRSDELLGAIVLLAFINCDRNNEIMEWFAKYF
jgi:hypothetical protein